MVYVIERPTDEYLPVQQRRSRRRPRLPATAGFYLLASIVVTLLASSSAPTPLYPIYQAEWGFSAITTTVVFGSYAIAVLLALLTVGGLSDHIGRKPVLLVTLAIQVATMVVFATADGVPQLMVARIVQGLATGAAIGAVGAGMLDINQARGTVANAVAPMTGTAVGALIAGIFVQFLPAPSVLVYAVIAALFVLQIIGVSYLAETTTPQPGALASLRPEVALPRKARRPMLVATPVLVAAWALGGFFLSLGPALIRTSLHTSSHLLGGIAVFILGGSAATTVLLLRRLPAVRMMTVGILGLIIGDAITVLAVTISSPVLFFASLVVSGVGFGASVQGAIRTVVPLADAHERAGLLSLVYVVSYLGLGLPAVAAGYLVVNGGGLHTAAQEYGIAVIVLALLALVALAPRRRARAA